MGLFQFQFNMAINYKLIKGYVYQTLEFLKFKDGQFSKDTVRIVNSSKEIKAFLEDTAPIDAGQEVTFTPFDFKLQRPTQQANDHNSQFTITVLNINNIIDFLTNDYNDYDSDIYCIIRYYQKKRLDIKPKVLKLLLNNISWNNLHCTIKMTVDERLTNKIPYKKYNLVNFPSIYNV